MLCALLDVSTGSNQYQYVYIGYYLQNAGKSQGCREVPGVRSKVFLWNKKDQSLVIKMHGCM